MENTRELVAELFGTFWLVLGGCGAAVFAANVALSPDDPSNGLGIGFIGVSFAFGLTVLSGAYAFGHVSGGHFNPAVTAGLTAAGKFPAAKAPAYVISQVIGAIAAGAVILLIANGVEGFEIDNSMPGAFAANGYGDLSPGGYSLLAALVAEIVLTAIFLLVILGSTAKGAAVGMGGMAIGLCLTLIHLVSIPITNTSVNPARSTSQAIFAGGDYIPQLWLFWVAPIVGGVIGAIIHKAILDTDDLQPIA